MRAALIGYFHLFQWMEKAVNLTTARLEREVARENPKASTPEKATYVSESRLNLSFGVSESLLQKLRRAQDLVSRGGKESVGGEINVGKKKRSSWTQSNEILCNEIAKSSVRLGNPNQQFS